MISKKCLDCQEEKLLQAFSSSKKNRDGRTSYCRPCMKIAIAYTGRRAIRAGYDCCAGSAGRSMSTMTT